jgi:nudix-type nucleoside diphosphatase (YffH/AdpP family)
MAAVAGPGPLGHETATLADYLVAPIKNNVVPMILPQPGAVATGLLWRGLTPDQQARLDAYEIPFGYQRITVSITLADGAPHAAQMYLPPPGIAQAPGDWALDTWEESQLAPTLLSVEEIFENGTVPEQADLVRRWAMVEHRAWARHRAAARPAVASIRHAPQAGDLQIGPKDSGQGSFFRLQGFDVTQRRFDGNPMTMRREVFWGAEAALLLPYDRVRDRVLLVEQARMGPALLGDANPWTLEPVAGMVDARETPLAAALRETREEAGLTIDTVEHIASYYASPGSSTDYFHSFLGLCDLQDAQSYTGGLAGESEDLRLHTLPFDHAMALITSSEITVGPLMLMLYWLSQHRDRLRATA